MILYPLLDYLQVEIASGHITGNKVPLILFPILTGRESNVKNNLRMISRTGETLKRQP